MQCTGFAQVSGSLSNVRRGHQIDGLPSCCITIIWQQPCMAGCTWEVGYRPSLAPGCLASRSAPCMPAAACPAAGGSAEQEGSEQGRRACQGEGGAARNLLALVRGTLALSGHCEATGCQHLGGLAPIMTSGKLGATHGWTKTSAMQRGWALLYPASPNHPKSHLPATTFLSSAYLSC